MFTDMMKPITDRLDESESANQEIIEATGEGFEAVGFVLADMSKKQTRLNWFYSIMLGLLTITNVFILFKIY